VSRLTDPRRAAVPTRYWRTTAAKRYIRAHLTRVVVIASSLALLAAAAVTAMTSADAATQDTTPAGAIKASLFASQSGAQVENTMDAGGGQDVGWLSSGDWMRYNGVDLGAAGTLTTSMRVAAAYADRPGTVEVRLDSLTGQLVATIPITYTGGWQSWATRTDAQQSPGGKHDVYLVMHSNQSMDYVNVNWFAFNAATTGGSPSATGAGSSTPGVPSSSPSTSTPTASAMPSMSATTTAGWIPIDQAKWQAQLAEFNALTPRSVTTTRHNPEFNATCTYSHSAKDDPIVFPGVAGASHMHSFIGNNSTNANTTDESLLALTASTCNPVQDHSAYWVPSLIENGNYVEPKQVIVYYGSLLADTTKTVPMPQGLRMIAGSAKLQVPTPAGSVNAFYCAGGPQDGVARSADGNWPVCQAGGTLTYFLRFPDCWDGLHLDSPDHKGHVSFGVGGGCPALFPVPIPAVSIELLYPTSGTTAGFSLSSGMASSMHGDGFFAWDNNVMAERVKDCVVPKVQCDTFGNP
jgi:hypothetical protein